MTRSPHNIVGTDTPAEERSAMKQGKRAMWTRFMDMHSGGGTKLWRKDGKVSDDGPGWGRRDENYDAVEWIFIEAPEEEAKAIFYKRFGRNPERVTCTCCGDDYSIDGAATLEAASAYERGCAWDDASKGYVERAGKEYREYQTLEQFLQRKDVHVIRALEIADSERRHSA